MTIAIKLTHPPQNAVELHDRMIHEGCNSAELENALLEELLEDPAEWMGRATVEIDPELP